MADSQPPAGGAASTEAAPADAVREALLAELRAELGDAIVGSEIARGDLWVRVDRKAWRKAGEALKHKLGFHHFTFLSGIDWMTNPDLSSRHEKIWDPAAGDEGDPAGDDGAPGGWETGVAGGDTRFQVFARVYSVDRKAGLTVKADLDDERPEVDSWVPVYAGADWHEREAWEMFGFEFLGHPGLRHIYLPSEFEGHPMRKDFPLLSREVKPWPGLVDKEPIPGEGESDSEEAGS